MENNNITINVPANLCALKLLPANAYKIYMYFCITNVDNNIILVNQQQICEQLNMSRNTYYTALNQLIQYKYLKRELDGVYTFCNAPEDI